MTTLPELRTQRQDAELLFQVAMSELEACLAPTDSHLIAVALGYHREVAATYAAELSLIGSGKLPNQDTDPS